MKLHPSVTNREFKLLIKPQGLDRRSQIEKLSQQILNFCHKNKVEFFHLDNATTGLRNIYFWDTPGEHFRQNNIILRVRESRQNVWVDDFCEVTLKCRTHDLEDSFKFDPKPKKSIKARIRLKEEILRGDGLGTKRLIYSNNAILDAVPLDNIFERTHASLTEFFPTLKKILIDKKTPIRIVVPYNWEGLCLLTAVNKVTGEEMPYEQLKQVWENINQYAKVVGPDGTLVPGRPWCRLVEKVDISIDEAKADPSKEDEN